MSLKRPLGDISNVYVAKKQRLNDSVQKENAIKNFYENDPQGSIFVQLEKKKEPLNDLNDNTDDVDTVAGNTSDDEERSDTESQPPSSPSSTFWTEFDDEDYQMPLGCGYIEECMKDCEEQAEITDVIMHHPGCRSTTLYAYYRQLKYISFNRFINHIKTLLYEERIKRTDDLFYVIM